MELGKFLNLCAMLFGLIAVLFLSKALFAGADQILRTTYHYSSGGWPSVTIISDKASQKSDTLASIILIVLAFILQLCSLFIKEDISFTSTCRNGIAIAVILVMIASLITHKIDIGFKRSFEREIKMLAARNYVKSHFEERSAPLYADVEAIAIEYFDFLKQDGEQNPNYVRRFASFLGYQIPNDVDFSKFR